MKTAATFIDLSKAFDSISHEILLQKLTILKFDDNAMSMMESVLTNRQQKVTLPSGCSEWIVIPGCSTGNCFRAPSIQ